MTPVYIENLKTYKEHAILLLKAMHKESVTNDDALSLEMNTETGDVRISTKTSNSAYTTIAKCEPWDIVDRDVTVSSITKDTVIYKNGEQISMSKYYDARDFSSDIIIQTHAMLGEFNRVAEEINPNWKLYNSMVYKLVGLESYLDKQRYRASILYKDAMTKLLKENHYSYRIIMDVTRGRVSSKLVTDLEPLDPGTLSIASVFRHSMASLHVASHVAIPIMLHCFDRIAEQIFVSHAKRIINAKKTQIPA